MLRFVIVVAAVLTGCAPGPPVTGGGVAADPPAQSTTTPTAAPEPSLAEAMRRWETVAGEHFRQSARALEAVSAAAAVGDDAAVREGCSMLHDTNSLGLQGHLPTPDPALSAELQRMIDDMNSATHACLRFVEHRDDADAEVYRDYLARAVDHLGRAKVILDADLRGR